MNSNNGNVTLTARRHVYPYFGIAAVLVWSHDHDSYAGSSVCYWLGSPIPDSSRVMTQTKRDTLAFQVGGGLQAINPTP